MSWYVVNFEVKHFHIIPMFVLTFICTFIFIRCWKEKYATSLFILSEWSGQNVTLISILNWRSEWTPKKRYSFASYPVCVLQCINILGRLINRVLNAIYRFSNILNILWNENDSCEGKKLNDIFILARCVPLFVDLLYEDKYTNMSLIQWNWTVSFGLDLLYCTCATDLQNRHLS